MPQIMLRQQTRRSRWLLITCLFYCGLSYCGAASFENKTGSNENNSPRVFSPRMDYDEWTPLGRGDPLKNDPTFDYVPPILDRVQYWMDSQTTEASSKSDILVLGVTAKKTSPKIPEQYLKFVNGPKFTRNQEPQGSYINDFTGSRGAETPKVIRKTTFRNGIKDYRNQNRIESIPASYYSSSYYNEKPETMMLPPPVVRNPDANRPHQTYDSLTKNHLYSDKHRYSTQTEAGPILQMKHQMYDQSQNSYSLPDAPLALQPPRNHHIQITSDRQKPTTKESSVSHIETIKSYAPSSELPVTQHGHDSTTPSVSSEKSDLIYQSSQTISGGWFAKTRQPTSPSLVDLDSVTWETDTSSNNREHVYEADVHQAAGSSHHEVVLGPNANIIVEGDSSDKEEIVIGQKEVIPSSELSSDGTMKVEALTGSNSENMYIVLANSSPPSETTIDQSKKESAVTVVMPENFVKNNLTSTTAQEDKLSPTSTPLDTHVVAETEKPEEKLHHPFGNVLTQPERSTYMNDGLAQPHSPTRIVMPHQQAPTRHAPHREFGDATRQRVVNHQPSHARPAQVMTHYSTNFGTGINFRETPPLSPPHSGMPMGHLKPNMRYTQPFKTITMAHQSSMTHVKQHNQPHRFFQHQFAQSPATTMTSNSVVHSMTSIPINSIRELLLRDEAHRNSQRMPQLIETTTSMPSRTLNDLEIFSNINTTKNNIGLQLAMQVEDDDFKRKILTTTESRTAPTPTTTSASPTTTAPTLTTDPIFSHYKQPANPMRGPMYLIIQGHSKVKTYKPWVDKGAENQVEKKGNFENTTSKEISQFDKFVKENTKKLADAERIKETKRTTERPNEPSIVQDSLLSFIDSGIGAFLVPSSRRDPNDKNSNSLATVNGN